MKIGDKIKKIRKEKGISQKELAEMLNNMPVSTLANYENNHRNPSIDMIDKLVEALDISWGDLLDNEKQREEFKTLEKDNAIKIGIYKVYLEIIQDIISKLIKHTITNYGSVELNEEQIDNISSNVVKLMKENISNELKTFMDK